jgi:hypothetical protein
MLIINNKSAKISEICGKIFNMPLRLSYVKISGKFLLQFETGFADRLMRVFFNFGRQLKKIHYAEFQY